MERELGGDTYTSSRRLQQKQILKISLKCEIALRSIVPWQMRRMKVNRMGKEEAALRSALDRPCALYTQNR